MTSNSSDLIKPPSDQHGGALIWILWTLLSVTLTVYLGSTLTVGEDQRLFLPGPTSHGHYQIELECESCHTDAFGGTEALDQACLSCHAEELKRADDSHPLSKFTDPRNADRVAKLDARSCVTCHSEHRPEITHPMGLTLPTDYCFRCHQEIGEERESHKDLTFDSCATAGCHNYHDNRALYEDFLVNNSAQPDAQRSGLLPERDFATLFHALPSYPINHFPAHPLRAADQDGRGYINDVAERERSEILAEWLLSTHARSGVNCRACHLNAEGIWHDQPDHQACEQCHSDEVAGFLAGRHGMRLAQDLTPMRPEMARLPMNSEVAEHELSCASCHAAHRYDTEHAAVEACLGCHDDRHSRAYLDSPHHRLWQAERAGEGEPGSGVSCATCHLPRSLHREFDTQRILVQHNQNDGLRPNEKMIRPVCLQCHTLELAIDALADRELIERNFAGAPGVHVPSIDWAVSRVE